MTTSGFQIWKVRLAVRLWGLLLIVKLAISVAPLPKVVDWLVKPPRRHRRPRLDPLQLSRINGRVLRIGPFQPRCLTRALVHLRCLTAQGDPAELVIGLPTGVPTSDAHAWVELHGRVVGPPPGTAGHVEFVRYPNH
jgi:hypothetical protein